MKQELKTFLSRRRKNTNQYPAFKPSAVLVLIFEKDGEYHVLFTKRTDRVQTHKGQVSFPGGACDAEDRTRLYTALREGFEEIGVKTGDIDVLGELDDVPTIGSQYVISPFVGVMPWPYEFEVCVEEVDAILAVPIEDLIRQACLEIEAVDWRGKRVRSISYYYEDEIIWGATARILNQFLEIWKEVREKSK